MLSNNYIECEIALKMKVASIEVDTDGDFFSLLEELKHHVKLDEQDTVKILEINNSFLN